MTTFQFEAYQFVPHPRPEVFGFFSDVANLEALTPPWLSFHIVTPLPIPMQEGTLIDYRLRVHGIPLRWRTRITAYEPEHRFVDEQLHGPYRLWRHEHRFEEVEGGTRMHDRVAYAPIGGAWMNRWFVRKDIERIFAYRAQRMQTLFSPRQTPRARAASTPGIGQAH